MYNINWLVWAEIHNSISKSYLLIPLSYERRGLILTRWRCSSSNINKIWKIHFLTRCFGSKGHSFPRIQWMWWPTSMLCWYAPHHSHPAASVQKIEKSANLDHICKSRVAIRLFKQIWPYPLQGKQYWTRTASFDIVIFFLREIWLKHNVEHIVILFCKY